MTSLIPRNYFTQEMLDFRREFDQIFQRFLSWPSHREEFALNAGFSPAVETFIDPEAKKFHCQVSLPGVDPKEVNLQIMGNTLTITGERSTAHETSEADYLLREVRYGAFRRSLVLPEGVEKDRLTAEYRNGILDISVPIAASALPRKVEIKALPGAATRHAAA
jgi:HSP20 family protein